MKTGLKTVLTEMDFYELQYASRTNAEQSWLKLIQYFLLLH
jgi:hypothetical protein